MGHEVTAFTWTGAVLLALCGLPQAIRVWRRPESARGLSWFFLGSWWAGELFLLVGVAHVVTWPVLANYCLNLGLISYMALKKMALPSGAEH